jgi:hypothetical protein
MKRRPTTAFPTLPWMSLRPYFSQRTRVKPQDIRVKPQDIHVKPQDIRVKPQDIRVKPHDIRVIIKHVYVRGLLGPLYNSESILPILIVYYQF